MYPVTPISHFLKHHLSLLSHRSDWTCVRHSSWQYLTTKITMGSTFLSYCCHLLRHPCLNYQVRDKINGWKDNVISTFTLEKCNLIIVIKKKASLFQTSNKHKTTIIKNSVCSVQWSSCIYNNSWIVDTPSPTNQMNHQATMPTKPFHDLINYV